MHIKKYIFALGNPVQNLKFTFHNIAQVVIELAFKLDNLKFKNKNFSKYWVLEYEKVDKLYIIFPLTYMNLSGFCVKDWVVDYGLDLGDILIVHDDMDIKKGEVKLRYNSNHGGHNGVLSVIENLGTKRFFRLKIGIGRPKNVVAKDYVLSQIDLTKQQLLDLAEKVKDKINNWILF